MENTTANKVTLPYFCSKERVDSFVELLRLLNKAPNTIGNHCKSICELYKWMNIQINLKPLRDHFAICDRYNSFVFRLLISFNRVLKDHRYTQRILNKEHQRNMTQEDLQALGKYWTVCYCLLLTN